MRSMKDSRTRKTAMAVGSAGEKSLRDTRSVLEKTVRLLGFLRIDPDSRHAIIHPESNTAHEEEAGQDDE